METSPLTCGANQWTGFYMITASVMKELNGSEHVKRFSKLHQCTFKERKMGPFKTKNCKFLTFPIATFCKAVFPKVYFHIQQELRVMFTEGKVKSLISWPYLEPIINGCDSVSLRYCRPGFQRCTYPSFYLMECAISQLPLIDSIDSIDLDRFFTACLEKLNYFVRHYCEDLYSLIVIQTGITCEKIPLRTSIEFDMVLKQSETCCKQKTGIFLVTR